MTASCVGVVFLCLLQTRSHPDVWYQVPAAVWDAAIRQRKQRLEQLQTDRFYQQEEVTRLLGQLEFEQPHAAVLVPPHVSAATESLATIQLQQHAEAHAHVTALLNKLAAAQARVAALQEQQAAAQAQIAALLQEQHEAELAAMRQQIIQAEGSQAQVVQLQNQVADLQATVATLQATVTALLERVG